MGWVIQTTPNGQIVWHDGGTMGFGAYIGMSRDKDLGVIVLSQHNQCRADRTRSASGSWTG